MDAQATRASVEILRKVGPAEVQASRASVEILRKVGPAQAQASRASVEILRTEVQPTGCAQATRASIEILRAPFDTTEPPERIVRNVFRLEAPPLRFPGEPDEHRRKIAQVVREMLNGRMNNTGVLTLTPNATQTTVTDIRVLAAMAVLLTPRSASAAAEAATTWVDPRNGSFIVNHADNAIDDREFVYAIFG